MYTQANHDTAYVKDVKDTAYISGPASIRVPASIWAFMVIRQIAIIISSAMSVRWLCTRVRMMVLSDCGGDMQPLNWWKTAEYSSSQLLTECRPRQSSHHPSLWMDENNNHTPPQDMRQCEPWRYRIHVAKPLSLPSLLPVQNNIWLLIWWYEKTFDNGLWCMLSCNTIFDARCFCSLNKRSLVPTVLY